MAQILDIEPCMNDFVLNFKLKSDPIQLSDSTDRSAVISELNSATDRESNFIIFNDSIQVPEVNKF